MGVPKNFWFDDHIADFAHSLVQVIVPAINLHHWALCLSIQSNIIQLWDWYEDIFMSTNKMKVTDTEWCVIEYNTLNLYQKTDPSSQKP